MDNLVNVQVYTNSNGMVTDSRNVAEVFGKQHQHILRDIRNIEKDVSNFGQMFFEGTMPDSYGREQKIYFMNRDGFSLLAMGFTGSKAMEWKLKYIEAFNKMEAALNTPEQVMARALKIADSTIENLQLENKGLREDIDRMKPKEIFADAVATAETSILVGELAKLLKQNGVEIGQNRLFAWLRENGYLISRKGTDYNMPTQKAMEIKLFEVKERAIDNQDGSVRIIKTPKVTGKGQQYFINKFIGNAS